MSIVSLFVLLGGCEVDPVDECASGDGPIGGISDGLTSDTVVAGRTLKGWVAHADGVAIREVSVGGVPATLVTTADPATWSVELSWDLLLASAREQEMAVDATTRFPVALEVEAVDYCGGVAPLGTADFTVDPDKLPDFEDLEVGVAYPDGQDYVPADGSADAHVTVSAETAMVGESATLFARGGTLGAAAANSVALVLDEANGRAWGTTTFRAAPGTGEPFVAVTAGASDEEAEVRVVGAPTIVPGSIALAPDEVLTVAVSTDGALAACTGTVSPNLGVVEFEADDDPLANRTVFAQDLGSTTQLEVRVLVPSSVEEAVTLTLSCADVFGQSASATYAYTPPPDTDTAQ